MKRTVLSFIVLLVLIVPTDAATWESIFAYNAVNQIAVTRDKVFALSEGALFSVNKQSERIEKYDSGSGLNGLNISCLSYSEDLDILIIGYEDGKIDLLQNTGVTYVSGLYTKDMTASKGIHNITLHKNYAYLSTDFGIVTFNLEKFELVDAYYIGAEASEVKVNDILIRGDSIYAFADNLLYKASMKDNIVDYRYWSTEPLGRIKRDENKGKIFIDSNGERWEAGGKEGVVRYTLTQDRLTYMPDGPLVNTPYQMNVADGRLYVVPGGRWGVQYMTPGCVMIYDGQKWTNIAQSTIQQATGGNPATDFMEVGVDPKDPNHFFVTAYGGGVYEFENTQVKKQYLPTNSSLISRVVNSPLRYTRCTGGIFDSKGNYWCLNTTESKTVHRLSPDGKWEGIALKNNNNIVPLYTTGNLHLDQRNENHKWIVSCREGVKLLLLDDNGTIEEDDDRLAFRDTWTTPEGVTLTPSAMFHVMQDRKNNIWLCTSCGPLIIPATEDFFTSDVCYQVDVKDDNGENLFLPMEVQTIAFDDKGQIWVGTTTSGVYVIAEDWKTVVAHYNSANSIMPSSYVMSLAFDPKSKNMYIGTSNGIVKYNAANSSSGGSGVSENPQEELDYGSIQRWRPHFSYTAMEKVVQTPTEVFALADGVVFSLNKEDETLSEWNKTTGLSSSNVTQIGYDKQTDNIVLCYSDGKIDLLDRQGNVTPMLDLYQKATSISVSVNSMYIHAGKAYLSMPFGIVVLNLNKAEVEDTYYIGSNAADVNVKAITIVRDTIYALSSTHIYQASLNSNLVDYSNWTTSPLPDSNKLATQIFTNDDLLYLLNGKVLLMKNQNDWQMVADTLDWVSCSDNHIFAYQYGVGLVEIQDSAIVPLADMWPRDAIYDASNRCYWLAVTSAGICKLSKEGKQYFAPTGPVNNNVYRLKFIGNQLFVAGGGRWGVQYFIDGNFSIYANNRWRKMYGYNAANEQGIVPQDIVSFAGKDDDPGHFFFACYGRGVYEYQDYKPINRYTPDNSTLLSAVPSSPDNYTRTDGILMDKQGYLWVLNALNAISPINVREPSGNWVGLKMKVDGKQVLLATPWELTQDNRNSQLKWIVDQRAQAGSEIAVYLFDDNGTPTDNSDDRCMKRNVFYDQDNTRISLSDIFCLTQDKNGDVWIGTSSGIIIIPSTVDFFTSDECYRVKIPRNDGTNLADYLLGTETVNCIAVDGANRKWIGTSNSGLYLMSEDGLTTEEHFTIENSLLPSNEILSIAIHPITGEVFAGTSEGIASYCSDASEGREDYSQAYAYPNPVRPNYEGSIAITGLMENSVVNIVDEGGNLICKTRSNGGTAVWDGKNQQGQKASSGIYTALCNASDGSHCVVKIMIMK